MTFLCDTKCILSLTHMQAYAQVPQCAPVSGAGYPAITAVTVSSLLASFVNAALPTSTKGQLPPSLLQLLSTARGQTVICVHTSEHFSKQMCVCISSHQTAVLGLCVHAPTTGANACVRCMLRHMPVHSCGHHT